MLAHTLVSTWQRMLASRGSVGRLMDGQAAIHRFNPIDDTQAWTRCRDRAQFHLGRARRAKDRGHYRAAAREIERALRFDDTSEAYFQVLGQCYLGGRPANLPAARAAFERAFAMNPRNGYTFKLLLRLYQLDDNPAAARNTIERARSSSAPVEVWSSPAPAVENVGSLAANA